MTAAFPVFPTELKSTLLNWAPRLARLDTQVDTVEEGLSNLTATVLGLVTGVSSVAASDSTLTISPTTGAVSAAVNQAADFTWTGTHNFSNWLLVNGLTSNSGTGILDLSATTRLADDNGVTIEGGPILLKSADYGAGSGISTTDSDIHLRSDLNLDDTDFDVLKFGQDNFFYSSGLPFRFLWSNFDTGNGRLEFDDGAGILQTFRANISAESVYADSLLYAPNVYVTSLATGRIPFSNGGNLSGSTNLTWDISNNRLGLGTSTPSVDLGFGGNAARSILVERTTGTTGNNLTVQAGGAVSGGTNRWGGTLRLSGGIATGNGSSMIEFYTAGGGTSGTADLAPTKKAWFNASGGFMFGSGAGSGFTNASIGAGIDVAYGGSPAGLAFGAENNLTTRTNSTNKVFRMGFAPYNTAHQLGNVLTANATSTQNIVDFGGGTSVMNGPTDLRFSTATAVGVASATCWMNIGTAGNVSIGNSTTAGGKKLDVNGDVRIRGDLGTLNFYRTTSPTDIAYIQYDEAGARLNIAANNKAIRFLNGSGFAETIVFDAEGRFGVAGFNTGLGYMVGFKSNNTARKPLGLQWYTSGQTANMLDVLNDAGTVLASITKDGRGDFVGLSLADASNIIFGTTTGNKLGTAASQKIGIWNATPIVQPTTAVAAATFVTNTSLIANDTATFDGYTIGQVVKALRNIGLLA